MPDQRNPLATIIAALSGLIPPASVIEPDALLDDIGLDGLDRQILAMDLEDLFQIEINDTTLEQWRTIADVVATVEKAHV
jgi:acyl carrier protein